jgi:hypothetical protein
MRESITLLDRPPLSTPELQGIAAVGEVAYLNELWAQPEAQDPQIQQAAAVQGNETDAWVSREEYGHSLRLLEMLGAAALESSLEAGEGARLKEIARDEWKSCLVEMLNTDVEFRKRLEVTRERAYSIRDGKVVCSDANGGITPMVDLIGRGASRSAQEAESDPRMQFQAERDMADLRNAQEVDKLEPGMMRIVVSMDPKAAFRTHGKEYVERLGYREGWASIQGYWRTPGNELATFTYTLSSSDMAVMREACNELGANVPANVTDNSFINHAITFDCKDITQARAMLVSLRDKSYQKQGITEKRYSVDEFLALNQGVVNQVFDTQYIALAIAHKRRLKDQTIQTFADALLQSPRGLGENAKAQLRDIYNKSTLADTDVRLMDYLLRYGLVERLRPALYNLGTSKQAKVNVFVAPSHVSPEQFIARSLVGNMIDGIRAGRTYGGCSKAMDLLGGLKGSNSDRDESERDPLDVFGGRDLEGTDTNESDKRSWRLKWDVCGVGSCPSRGTNPKRPLKVLCGPCGVCMKRCQKIFDAGADPTTIKRADLAMAA